MGRWHIGAGAALWLSLMPSIAQAALSVPALDPGFNVTGKVKLAFGAAEENASAIIRQADGKLVVAGSSRAGDYNQWTLVRLNSNGSLDSGFDGDGKLQTVIDAQGSAAYALAQQPDGKLVAAGARCVTGNTLTGDCDTSEIALVRYNTDGSLDSSFDGDGIVTTAVSARSYAHDLLLQADGKLVVISSWDVSPNGQVAVLRYNADGSPDTTFDGDGIVVTSSGNRSWAAAIAQQLDGKLVVAGSVTRVTDSEVLLLRYNLDGTLDTGFGTNGAAITSASSGHDYANSLLVQPDGKLVVAGEAGRAFLMLRFDSGGALDTTFSGDGIATARFGSSAYIQQITRHVANAVALQGDGKLLAAGYTCGTVTSNDTCGETDVAVARYNSDGTPDSTFGTAGLFMGKIGSSDDYASAMVLQPDGKMVLAGRTCMIGGTTNGCSGVPYFDMAVVRYITDPDSDNDGFLDYLDLCPLVADPDQLDTDADGSGNACDSDDDNDGTEDVSDAFPLQYAASADPDNDGSPDAWLPACDVVCQGDSGLVLDNCPGVQNVGQLDTDSDGAGNACDSDDDGDGLADAVDNCKLLASPDQTDTDSDGNGNLCDNDDDGDGIADVADNCPLHGNANQLDLDADGMGNPCDDDVDGDAVLNDADPDDDNDGTDDVADGMPHDPSDILDSDGDGTGNNSDPDDDNDSILDVADVCPLAANHGYNTAWCDWLAGLPPDWLDSDGDGLADSEDDDPLSSNGFQPDEAFHGDIGNRWDDAVHDMVVQADGRIAVTGYYTNARGLAGIYLQRLMPDGSRDPSFNTYGTLWIPNKQVALYVPLSIIQQADGKLVITGYKRTPYGIKSLLMRFNADGSFDNTFGKRGKRLLRLGRASVLSDIVQQPDGKLVAVGSALPGGLSVTTLVVARFLPDGKPDKTFGIKGQTFIASASGDASGYSLLLQDDGRIVVAGSTEDGSTLSSLLVRLSPSGQLDSSFGNGGGTLTSMSPYADETYKVIEQMDGKLVAVGYALTSLNAVVENRDLAVARYTADGQPDTGFGVSGVSVLGTYGWFGQVRDEAADVLQLPNGQLLLGGVVKGGMGFMVLEADGQPAGGDASSAAHNAGFSGAILANAIGLQPDGKVLLAGFRSQLDQHEGKYYNDSVVARFHGGDVDGDGAPDVLDPYPLDSDNDGVNNADEAMP